jgi:TolB-like protein/DNA-binding winged helix-turn-helix (wHTH) protein
MDATKLRKLTFDGYTLDPLSGRLTLAGADIALRPKAFEVLCRLVESAPNLVPKERLIDAVWPDVVVGDDSLVQCVREIRIALHDDEQKLIRTVPRRGYVFTRPVSEAIDLPSPQRSPAPHAASETAPADARAPRRARWWLAGSLAAALVVVIAVFAQEHFNVLIDRWLARSAAPSTAALTIAVLPLRNLSGDADQDYLAEALSADLTTDLSRLPNSMVIARASAARYRGAAVDSRRVGAELGVRYLIQGSVRRLDDDVRLNLQLIEAATGEELWADRFDERRDRLATLQRQVTASLSRTLHVRLVDAESQRRLREHAGHPMAEDLALRGWYLWQQNRPDTVARARELLLQAVQLDPTYAYAWACLNFTYISDLTNNWIDLRSGHTWAEWLQRADEAANKAYQLDPNLSASMGARSATLMLQGRTDESIALREKQIAIAPNDPIAYHNLAALKLHAGHPEQVLAHEQQAMRDPKLHQMMGIVALAELHMHHDRQALQWAERAVAVNPDYGGGHAYVASAAAHLGDASRAHSALAEFRRELPKHRIQTLRDEFSSYSSQADYQAGQEHYYDGLRKAGLPD